MNSRNTYNISHKKVWIAGHNGMVGRAIKRRLKKESCEILTVDKEKIDLTDQLATDRWLKLKKPDVIFMAAAKVGGIKANTLNKYSFLYDNLMIQNNIINSATYLSLDKLIFLGSSCIYPKNVQQPIKEESLLDGKLEPTNEGYALAKIAGLKLCEYYNEKFNKDFISVMPSNLYGPYDNFDPDKSHVLGSLLRKVYNAKVEKRKNVEIWGTGIPRREFLFVDDLAEALIFLLENYSESKPINVGTSKDISVNELAILISNILNHDIKLVHDREMPDGTFLKRLDTTKINKLGWTPAISLKDGIIKTLDYCMKNNIFEREK